VIANGTERWGKAIRAAPSKLIDFQFSQMSLYLLWALKLKGKIVHARRSRRYTSRRFCPRY
jgi:hypothetical protein